MKDIVEWIVARRYRMVLLTTALFLAAITHPLLSPLVVIAQAMIVLAVLTRGTKQGVLVALLATALLVLPRVIAGADASTMFAAVALNWLPPLMLAALLDRTGSISLTTQVAIVFVSAAVVLFFALGSPMTFWSDLMQDSPAQQNAGIGEVTPGNVWLLTRLFGGATLLASMCAIYLGRWWQASVSKPGAFGLEFRGLRMGVVVGVLAGVIFIAAGLTRIAVLDNLTLVMLTGFMLQGLAVVHSLAAVGMAGAWVVAVYVLLLTIPFAALAVAMLGFIDNWFDLRSRLVPR